MSEASRQPWNRDQIPEMGSLDSLSMVFPQREYRVRRRRPPRLGYRSRVLTMLGELGETGQVHQSNAIRPHDTIGYVNRQTNLPGKGKERLPSKKQSSRQFENVDCSQSISFNP